MINNLLRRMSVRRRIVGSFLILLIFLTLFIPLTITDHLSLTGRVEQLANVNAKSNQLLLSALADILSSRVNLMRYADDLTPSVSEALNDVGQAMSSIEEARTLVAEPEQKTAMANILAGLVSYSTLITDVQTARLENRHQDVTTLLSNSYRLEFNLEQQIRNVVDTNVALVNETNESTLAVAQQRLIILVVSYIGALLLAIGIAAVVQQSITRPVSELRHGAETFRQERRATSIPSEGADELSLLARTFNQITSELSQTLTSLEQRVESRTKAMAASAEVSRRLSTILDKNQLVSEVVEQVKRAFDYYHAHIYLIDEPSGDLVMAGGTGEAGAAMLAQEHKVQKGAGLVGRAAMLHEVVVVPDTTQNKEWLPNPLLPETKSEIAVPIMAGERVLGVLDVQNNVAGSLGQQDADLLRSIADQVAVALQNIGSLELTAKRAKELASVAEISTAASSETDMDKMLKRVVFLTQRRFGLYHAHIFLYNEAAKHLEIMACGWKEGDEHEGTHGTTTIPIEQEQSLVARSARTKKPVIVNNVKSDPGWLPNPLLPDTTSELAVPLLVGEQVIGVLDIQSDRRDAFTDDDSYIQITLASQVAAALQNIRNLNQARRHAERETMLNTISQRIQSATTVESAMQIAARELGHALGQKPTLVMLGSAPMDGNKKDEEEE